MCIYTGKLMQGNWTLNSFSFVSYRTANHIVEFVWCHLRHCDIADLPLFFGASENPNPGMEGQMTSKASSGFRESVSKGRTFTNSQTEPGQPWINSKTRLRLEETGTWTEQFTGPLWGEWSIVLDSSHKEPVVRSICVSFVVTLNTVLNTKSSCLWLETPWRSCVVTVIWLDFDGCLWQLMTTRISNPTCMMTSSNGNILCGEFTGPWWIPLTKASDAELWCFLWSVPEQTRWINNREAGDLRRYQAHYDISVMVNGEWLTLTAWLVSDNLMSSTQLWWCSGSLSPRHRQPLYCVRHNFNWWCKFSVDEWCKV